jgi:DDE family transposase
MPIPVESQAPVPPPAYHRAQARLGPALQIDALTLVNTLHLLPLCHVAVRLAYRRCPPPLPAGLGGAPRTYREESLLLIALLRTLWRLSYQDMHDWLRDWPALALACGLPLGKDGHPHIPSPSHQWKRGNLAGAPLPEALFILTVLTALRRRLIGARDLIIDSVPILAWRRADPDAAFRHAPAQHPRPLLRGYRVHTLICRGSGLPLFFLLSPANTHDAPFARPLLAWAVQLYRIRPCVIRLDAAYWGLRLIAWIHGVLGAVAVIRLPSQTPEKPLLFASHLDQRGVGQTQLHRTLLWPRFSLLSRGRALLSLAGPLWFGRSPSRTQLPSSSLWLPIKLDAPIVSALPHAF